MNRRGVAKAADDDNDDLSDCDDEEYRSLCHDYVSSSTVSTNAFSSSSSATHTSHKGKSIDSSMNIHGNGTMSSLDGMGMAGSTNSSANSNLKTNKRPIQGTKDLLRYVVYLFCFFFFFEFLLVNSILVRIELLSNLVNVFLFVLPTKIRRLELESLSLCPCIVLELYIAMSCLVGCFDC